MNSKYLIEVAFPRKQASIDSGQGVVRSLGRGPDAQWEKTGG